MRSHTRKYSVDTRTRLLNPSDASGFAGAPSLVVIRGQQLGRRIDLGAGPVLIGRSPDCDVLIAERSVSRAHCRVFQQDQGYWVEDLGSTNASFVNDVKIERRQLVDGDQLRVGKTVFKFLDVGNPEAGFLAQLRNLAMRDDLTGLYNRRHATEVLIEEFDRRQRVAGARLAFAIIDIDWFKQINDQIGHLAGDAVLQELARVLSDSLRAGDTLARIGGEEFALIMPDTSLKEAHEACDRLRQQVARHEFLSDSGKCIEVTISVGLAEARPEMRGYQELLAAADRYLYDAKTGGRNSVRSLAG